MCQKEEKHGKSAKTAFGGHIEYFISKIKVMCLAMNEALNVCKIQLPTIGVNESS